MNGIAKVSSSTKIDVAGDRDCDGEHVHGSKGKQARHHGLAKKSY